MAPVGIQAYLCLSPPCESLNPIPGEGELVLVLGWNLILKGREHGWGHFPKALSLSPGWLHLVGFQTSGLRRITWEAH